MKHWRGAAVALMLGAVCAISFEAYGDASLQVAVEGLLAFCGH